MKGLISISLYISQLTLIVNAACPGPVDLKDNDAIKTSLGLSVSCFPDSIVVGINPCVLEQMKYDPSTDITVNGYQSFSGGTACAVLPTYAATSSWVFTINEPLNECGTFFRTKINGNLVYKNFIQNIAHENVGGDGIVRRKDISIPFECTYPNTFEQSRIGGFDPEVPLVSGDVLSGSGDFEVDVKLCKDDGCSNIVALGEVIEVLSRLYLVATTRNSGIKIIIINIIASDVNGNNQEYLVQDGCLVEAVYSAITNPGINGGKTYLEFYAFYLAAAENDDIYFTVEGELCEIDSGTCVDPCGVPGRRRRRSLLPQMREPISVTIGPFKTKVV